VFKVEDEKVPPFTLWQRMTAAGGVMPPTIVVAALKRAKSVFPQLNEAETAHVASSATGVGTGVIYEAFGDRLIGHVRALRLKCPSQRDRPFFLFVDTATTQASLSLLERFARENNVYLSFPPQKKHLLQPIDVSRRARSRRSSLSSSTAGPTRRRGRSRCAA
jgi:hypothetical protein